MAGGAVGLGPAPVAVMHRLFPGHLGIRMDVAGHTGLRAGAPDPEAVEGNHQDGAREEAGKD